MEPPSHHHHPQVGIANSALLQPHACFEMQSRTVKLEGVGTQRSSTHGVDIRIAVVPAFPNTRISRELLYGTTNGIVSKRDKTLLTPASNSLVASRDFRRETDSTGYGSTPQQHSMLTATSCHTSHLATRMAHFDWASSLRSRRRIS